MRMFIPSLLMILICGFTAPAQSNNNAANEVQLVLPPRELLVKLENCQKSLEEEYFEDGFALLGELLSVNSNDYLVKNSQKSLRTLALEEIYRLSPAGHEALELRSGKAAEEALQIAIKTSRIAEIEAVARDFVGTKAGANATLLAARYWLDRDHSARAIRYLDSLKRCAYQARLHQPELTILQASALLRLGRRASAIRVIESFTPAAKPDFVMIAGKKVEWPENAREISAWLDQNLTSRPSRKATRSSATHPLGKLNLTPVWSADLSPSKKVRTVVQRLARQLESNGHPAVAHPIIAGGFVVARSLDGVYGLDVEGGKRVWRHQTGDVLVHPLTFARLAHRRVARQMKTVRVESLNRYGRNLYQKIWLDSHFAKMSQLNHQVFVLTGWQDRLEFLRNGEWGHGCEVFGGKQSAEDHNRIVALSLEREGALDWSSHPLGEESSDEFISSRVCQVDDQIVFLIRKKLQLSLRVCNSSNSEIVWEQPLVTDSVPVSTGFRFQERFRPVPIHAMDSGLVIVLVNNGVLFGIDLWDRRIAWHCEVSAIRDSPWCEHLEDRLYVVPQDDYDGNNAELRSQIQSSIEHPDTQSLRLLCNSSYCVVRTPTGFECYDVLNGRLASSLDAGPEWKLEAAVDDWFLIVAGSRMAKVDCRSSQRTWSRQVVALPSMGMQYGRGVIIGDSYFVPTNSREIVVVDLNHGDLRAIQVDKELGNLATSGDWIVTQTPLDVHAWQLAWQDGATGESKQSKQSEPIPSHQARESTELHDEPVAAELVRQLGDKSFAKREAAAKLLEKLGPSAMSALTAGLASVDLEIRHRSRILHERVSAGILENAIDTFLAGKSELPGWPQVRELFGDSQVGRELYSAAYRADFAILDRFASETCEAKNLVKTLHRRTSTLIDEMQREQPPMGAALTACALSCQPELRDLLLDQSNWLGNVVALFQSGKMRSVMRDQKKAKVVKRLVSELARQNNESTAVFGLASNWNLPEKTEMARAILKKEELPGSYLLVQAINVTASEKRLSDIEILKRFVTNKAQALRHGMGNNRNYLLQVRDAAMFAIISVNGEKPTDFGFKLNPHMPGYPIGFINDEDRNAAFEKWQKYTIRKKTHGNDVSTEETGGSTNGDTLDDEKPTGAKRKDENSIDMRAINPFG